MGSGLPMLAGAAGQSSLCSVRSCHLLAVATGSAAGKLKFCEVRGIKALCIGGPALLLWLHRASVSLLLGLCCGLGLQQHSRNSPVSLVGRMVFVTRLGGAPVWMTTQCWAVVLCWPGFLLLLGSLPASLSSSWARWFFQPPCSSSGCTTLK